jgi:hypothetical protein
MRPRPSDTTLLILGPPTAPRGAHQDTAHQLHAAGYQNVLTPLPQAGWQGWFKYCAETITSRADGVVLLPGTVSSRGGKLLTDLAFELGLPIHTAQKWVDMAREKVPW